MKKLLLLLPALLVFSCKPAASLIYGANRNLTFDTREEAAAFYQKKNGLDPASLYFFDNHNEYVRVLTDTTRLNSIPYYGIAVSDSLMVDDRTDVTTSCVGVSASYLAAYNGNTAMVPNPLKGVKLTNIYGKMLTFDTGRPTAVLMAHSNLGRTLKSDLNYYKETTKQAGKEYNYIVIAMDVPLSDHPKKAK